MSVTVDPMGIGPTLSDHVTPRFTEILGDLHRPKVLELGTRRWDPNLSTHHLEWAPPGSTYVMSDITDGPDVDVVADAHTLEPFPDGAFDAVIAVSVFEHLARPWVAARQIARVLDHGGHVYIATHQTFPIHGYPADFWRYTAEALDIIFGDAGLDLLEVGYGYPCRIWPGAEVTRWNPDAPCWLNVTGIWRRP